MHDTNDNSYNITIVIIIITITITIIRIMIICRGRLRAGSLRAAGQPRLRHQRRPRRAVDFRNFIVFFGPRPWHIEIRHRVKNTSTINLFGFETLILKIRRLKLCKPTVGEGAFSFWCLLFRCYVYI